jgi:hypothetical protein
MKLDHLSVSVLAERSRGKYFFQAQTMIFKKLLDFLKEILWDLFSVQGQMYYYAIHVWGQTRRNGPGQCIGTFF